VWLLAKTMVDDEVAREGGGKFASEVDFAHRQCFKGAMFVFFEITVFLLRSELEESSESARTCHTNVE